jgi:O-antigen/teichoic acid export membrane protein
MSENIKSLRNSLYGSLKSLGANRIISHDLVHSGSLYFGSTLISSLIGFLVLPTMSYFLTVNDIGVIGIFMILTNLLTPVVGLSMNTIIAKSYYSQIDKNTLIGSSQIFSLLIFFFIFFIALNLPEFFFQQIGVNRLVLLSVCLVSFLGINNAVMMTIYQLEKLPLYWCVASLSSLMVNVAVTFLFLFFVETNYWARIFGYIFSSFFLVIINILLTTKILVPKYTLDLQHYMYFLRLGAPLIVFACGVWGIFFLDRLFIQFFLGIKAVGFYTMAFALASPMKILSESFSRAWLPYAYEFIEKGQDRILLRKSFIIFIVFCIIGLLITILGYFCFPHLVDRKFLPSLNIVPILIAGFTLNISTKLLTPHLLHSEKVKVLASITFTAVIINIVLNYLLIEPFGIIGAALSTMISLFTMSLMVFVAVFKSAIRS